LHTAAYTEYSESGPIGLIPDSSHGTSMASCSAGSFAGPAKDAMLGLVRLKSNNPGYALISSVMLAFDTIISHSRTVNSRGRSVVGMSFGAPVVFLWWPHPIGKPVRSGLVAGTDVFGVKLRDIYAVGIAAVQSAGNGAQYPSPIDDLSFQTPRRNGGANTPLIVVGNNDINNVPYFSSQTVDSGGNGILSMYAVGVNCVCGMYNSTADNTAAAQNNFRLLTDPATNGATGDENGSSQAAAQTVGIVANMLSDPTIRSQLVAGGLPNFAMAVKTKLIQIATTNKGVAFPDGFPRLSNGIAIPCLGVAAQGAPSPPASNTPPLLQTGLTPTFQEVASGLTITFPNPVSSYSSHLTSSTVNPLFPPLFLSYVPSLGLLQALLEHISCQESFNFYTNYWVKPQCYDP